jgi:hypothetical protein
LPCFAMLHITNSTAINPTIAEAIKAVVSIVVGCLGAVLTNWLNNWLKKHKNQSEPTK